MDTTNIGPYVPPLILIPIPIPGVTIVPCRGGKQTEKEHTFDDVRWAF